MAGKHRSAERKRLQALLREIRLEKKLTQQEVADRLNKPQSYVSKYENGERKLDLPEIDEVCEAVDVYLVDFIKLYKESES